MSHRRAGHEEGRLRAYLDGELPAPEAEVLERHLRECSRCSAGLEAMRACATAADGYLQQLEAPSISPDPRAALVRFRRSTVSRAEHPSLWETLRRSFDMTKKNLISPRWRPGVAAITIVLTFAILLSIAPVREAAADFLSLFRVRKFAVIPIDPAQASRLEGLAQQAENVLGEPKVLREEGPAQPVSDAAQASALAGFTVRVPTALPENATQTSFVVRTGPAIQFEVNRSVLEALLQSAGASTAGLPQTETISASVDVAAGANLSYQVGAGKLDMVQMPAPSVNLPDGLDLVALSETGFQLLGIPADEARRLATTIDWSSTLVVPLPTDIAQAQEVTVDGVTGLLVQSTGEQRRAPELVLIWQRDDILYAIEAQGVPGKALLQAADSLQ